LQKAGESVLLFGSLQPAVGRTLASPEVGHRSPNARGLVVGMPHPVAPVGCVGWSRSRMSVPFGSIAMPTWRPDRRVRIVCRVPRRSGTLALTVGSFHSFSC
jgi:hypothetical protein